MNNILPIGSVVMLENGTKPVMIFGYLQKSNLAPDMIADYVGVPYPEGNLGLGTQIGFQMNEIKEVLFEGYATEAFEPWKELLILARTRHQDSR